MGDITATAAPNSTAYAAPAGQVRTTGGPATGVPAGQVESSSIANPAAAGIPGLTDYNTEVDAQSQLKAGGLKTDYAGGDTQAGRIQNFNNATKFYLNAADNPEGFDKQQVGTGKMLQQMIANTQKANAGGAPQGFMQSFIGQMGGAQNLVQPDGTTGTVNMKDIAEKAANPGPATMYTLARGIIDNAPQK